MRLPSEPSRPPQLLVGQARCGGASGDPRERQVLAGCLLSPCQLLSSVLGSEDRVPFSSVKRQVINKYGTSGAVISSVEVTERDEG